MTESQADELIEAVRDLATAVREKRAEDHPSLADLDTPGLVAALFRSDIAIELEKRRHTIQVFPRKNL